MLVINSHNSNHGHYITTCIMQTVILAQFVSSKLNRINPQGKCYAQFMFILYGRKILLRLLKHKPVKLAYFVTAVKRLV
jgi:hypothetical protein